MRDALNRLLCITYANGTTEQASYHVHNNRKTVTDGNQSSRTNSYDLMNRLIARTIVPGNGVLGTAVETYKYDGLGRVVYAENSEPNGIIVATETFAYDSLGQLITQSLNGRTVSSVHDGAGNETALTYPGGRILTTSYDALNRKSVISDQGGAQLAQYFYVGPFREEGAFLGNNVLFGTAFDSARRPYVIEHVRDPNGTYTPIDLRTMLWDASSNKIRRVDLLQGLTHNLTYDSVDRMVASTLNTTPPTAISYTLDGVGNRTSVTGGQNPGAYTMDPNNPPGDAQMNQYTTTPMDARTYDSNGNLKQITGANPPAGTFVYDYQNRMVQFTDSLTSRQHSYAYDCFGRLIKKVVDTGGTPIETRYFYDGWQVVEERDGTDTVQATYVYGNYVDEVITMRRAGNDYYYMRDDQYNVIGITDAGGTVLERYGYGDFGQPVDPVTRQPITSSPVGNPFFFTGRTFDPQTRLSDFRTCAADPIAGTFTTRSAPIGAWAGVAGLGSASAFNSVNPWSSVNPYGWSTPVAASLFSLSLVGANLSVQQAQIGLSIGSSPALAPGGAGGFHAGPWTPGGFSYALWSWPIAGIGAGIGAVGGFGYGIGQQMGVVMQGGSWSWGAVANSTVTGAAIGFVGGGIAGGLTGDPTAALATGTVASSAGLSFGAGFGGGLLSSVLPFGAPAVPPRPPTGNWTPYPWPMPGPAGYGWGPPTGCPKK